MNLYIDVDPKDLEASPGKGTVPSPYALVGIAPSPSRPAHRRNEPFGSKSHAMLQNIQRAAPGPIYVTNLCKTPIPAGDKLAKALVNRWYPRLIRELQFVKPQRIIVMGTPVAKALCPGFTKMREDHGTLFYNPTLGCYVVPTYHFSAVGRDPMKRPILARDIQRFFTLPDPIAPPAIEVEEVDSLFPEGEDVFLDIETTGLNYRTDQITFLAYKARTETEVKVLRNPTKAQIRRLYAAIKQRNCTTVGHNLQFDLNFLAHHGQTHWATPCRDSMFAAKVWGEEVLGLKHLTTMYTNRPGSRSMGGYTDVGYVAEDVLSTEEVEDVFRPRLESSYALDLMNRLITTTVGMKQRGVFIDRPKLVKLRDKQRLAAAMLEQHLNGRLGRDINWGSNQQVAEALTEQGIKLTEKTKKGAPSVAEAVLLELQKQYGEDSIVGDLLKYRAAMKELAFYQSYYDMTADDHPYLHPHLKLQGTRTGRISCVDPNLQQVPREGPVKSLFMPRWENGKIGLIDLAQAELRIACLISGDRKFLAALLAEDIHRRNAAQCYHLPEEEVSSAQRKKIKGVTFGVMYGGSAGGLAKRIGISKAEVQSILDWLFGEFPDLAHWLKMIAKTSIASGEVWTHFGRRRDLTPILAYEGESGAARKAQNTPIQGLASDIALFILDYVAMALVSRKFKSRPLFPVHDSVLIEIFPGEEEGVAHIVQEAFRALYKTPLATFELFHELPIVGEFIIGNGWAQCESTSDYYEPDLNLVYPCSSLQEMEPTNVDRHDTELELAIFYEDDEEEEEADVEEEVPA